MTDFDAFAASPSAGLDRLERSAVDVGHLRVTAPRLDPPAVGRIVAALRTGEAALRRKPASELVSVLGRVGARFGCEGDAVRERALSLLPATAGISPPMARAVLDGMARDWTEHRLVRALESDLGPIGALDRFTTVGERRVTVRGPRLCVQVVAGSVPGVGVSALLRSLLVKSPTLLKPGAGDVVLPVLFARALREEDPTLADALAVVYWPGGSVALERAAASAADVVVAYGSDDTVGALRALCPPATRFVAYHHRSSAGAVGRRALTEAGADAAAESVARAVALFDQRGCVSPHTVFVEEGGAVGPDALAERLARALERLEETLPAGPLDLTEAAALQQARGTAEMLGAAGSGTVRHGGARGSWTVVLQGEGEADDPSGAAAATVGRLVRLRPFTRVEEVAAVLAPIGDHLQTMGVTGFDEDAEAALAAACARVGVTRIAPFEAVPFPPAWWYHDGRPPIGELVRWVEWEDGGSADPGP